MVFGLPCFHLTLAMLNFARLLKVLVDVAAVPVLLAHTQSACTGRQGIDGIGVRLFSFDDTTGVIKEELPDLITLWITMGLLA